MRLVPFNLDKWKQGWKPFTSEGRPVSHLTDASIYSDNPHPLRGFFGGSSYCWNLQGDCGDVEESNYQLMLEAPAPEREYWYRLMQHGEAYPWSSPQENEKLELVCIREMRPNGSWRVLASAEMMDLVNEGL